MSRRAPLFVFITGGVMSSLGKGITAATLGALLHARGARVRLRKLDPYLNVDPGTMNPCQHGEVFVTDDGAETDLDIGHYERFAGVNAVRADSITTGKLYLQIIEKERRGDYLGQTVQIVPHVTEAIKQAIMVGSTDVDVMICEIGGTVGDMEGLPFLEAIRQIRHDLGAEHTVFMHLSWVAYLESVKELKTKPVQHSVKELQRSGIQPDVLVCRCSHPLSEDIKKKIGLFCNINMDNVVEARDVHSIYEAPLTYYAAGLDRYVSYLLGPQFNTIDLAPWRAVNAALAHPKHQIKIAVVGKYKDCQDAYKSMYEALVHAGLAQHCRIHTDLILGQDLEEAPGLVDTAFKGYDGILVPGGFGHRGSEGIIQAIRYAREHHIPFFGICFGMQLAVIEAARHQAGLEGANSTELAHHKAAPAHPVVGLLVEWMGREALQRYQEESGLGGTMRLGAYTCRLRPDSQIAKIYGQDMISERHRHRYEVNEAYAEDLEKVGLRISGRCTQGALIECVERPDHPWFIAVQFHPEFKSRPAQPHPLFHSFVEAALQYHKARTA